MKLSTRGEYGLRAMFELAAHSGEGPLPLKSIAESQEISISYLEQLMAVLKKNKLVQSTRGAQGGYLLAKDPAEITVGAIVRALEGPVVQVKCIDQKHNKCTRIATCISRRVWIRLKAQINELVDSITLADMLKEAELDNLDQKSTKE